jgi:uncharacterized protein (TIGR02145 family)
MNRLFAYIAIILMALSSCRKEKKGLAAIKTTAVSSVTSTSVQTGGEITDDGGSSIVYRGVCWATKANPTVADSVTHDGTGAGSFTTALTKLSPNVTYFIRAYAINSTGTSYGNEISFTTSPGVPSITTTAITDIVSRSAKSGGVITTDGGAPVTARGIVWATTPSPTILNFKTNDGNGTGTFTSTMTSLASQTIYYIRAYATNSLGTAYGNEIQFSSASANTVTDTEGNVYSYVTICGKNWMAESLKTTKYRNGDAITNGTSGFNWSTSTTGAYVYPNGEINKVDSFGLLYNIYAVNDGRGVCPSGWRLPTDAEWKELEICQGMTSTEADLTGFRGTIAPKLREGGTSGLNLRLGGYVFQDGSYQSVYTRGFFWSGTSEGASGNWYRGVTNPENASNGAKVRREPQTFGMCIRCIQN